MKSLYARNADNTNRYDYLRLVKLLLDIKKKTKKLNPDYLMATVKL
ncbi:MAG: hypothetical protein E6649_05460 [Paeniclostridium sordellii]|nr:hypothetical protein [Paeniclostridium sordellii]